jgi:glycosyltransferase involved in cell wall biosynthesis
MGYKDTNSISICILNSVHPYHDTRVNRIAKTLADIGYSITLISPVVPPDLVSKEFMNGGITYIENRRATGNFIANRGIKATLSTFISRLLVSYSLFIKGWRANSDIYHCNEVDSWFVGILLKILLRRKLVFDVHEYYPSIIIEYVPGRRLKIFVEKIFLVFFSLLSRLTDHAIFVNQSIAHLYNFKCNYSILRNLIRCEDVEFGRRNLELEEKFKDKLVLLHVGPLREAWGTSVILKALGLIKEKFSIVLIVLGGIQDGRENYYEMVRQLKLEEYIYIVEKIPFDQVVEYLNFANVGLVVVQPWSKSFINSLPRKFLEYIAAGLPVIASDFPEMRHLVEKYELGLLIYPEIPQSLAGAIETMALNPDVRKFMGRNSKIAFRQNLNWDKESRGLIDLYSQLTG